MKFSTYRGVRFDDCLKENSVQSITKTKPLC